MERHHPGRPFRGTKTGRLKIRWSRSATKHRISKERSRHVIEHCESWLELPSPAGGAASPDTRRLYLGDDADGVSLEVMAVERDDGSLFVIHAMELRARFAKHYEKAKEVQDAPGDGQEEESDQ